MQRRKVVPLMAPEVRRMLIERWEMENRDRGATLSAQPTYPKRRPSLEEYDQCDR